MERLFLTSSASVSHAAQDVSFFASWPIVAFVACAALILFLLRCYDSARLTMLLLVATLASGLSASVLRTVTGRARPSSHFHHGFYGLRADSKWIVGRHEFSAFPSGHTAVAAGFAAACYFLRRRYFAVSAGFALAVGWARIALGCHHFSDVVAAVFWSVLCVHWTLVYIEPGLSALWKRWHLYGIPTFPDSCNGRPA